MIAMIAEPIARDINRARSTLEIIAAFILMPIVIVRATTDASIATATKLVIEAAEAAIGIVIGIETVIATTDTTVITDTTAAALAI